MRDAFEIRPARRLEMLPPYVFGQLNDLRARRRQQGEDVIDLGMGNPTDPAPDPIVEKLIQAVRDPRNHRYSHAKGLANLRAEVARFYQRRFGVQLDSDAEIISTIGSKEGFSHLVLALMDVGDVALVPTPAFPIHMYSVGLAGATAVGVAMSSPEQLLRDLTDLARKVHPKPKVLVLNFPHNPTAATVEIDFMEDVADFAAREGIFVIHDFAYGLTCFDGYQAPSFLQTREGRRVGVEFITLSKAYNMAGWRVGFCAGNRHAVAALARVKGYFDYGLFQPVQIASIIALRHCDRQADEQAQRYQRRRDALCSGLTRIGWDVTRPRATMFVWAKVPEPLARMGSVKLAFAMMEEANVAVAPGAAFGSGGEGFLRMALVENEKRLRQAVRQIGKAFPLRNVAHQTG
jgi:alanine-synthesizing transaminase